MYFTCLSEKSAVTMISSIVSWEKTLKLNKIKNRKDFETFKTIIEQNNIDFYFKNEDINDKSIIADNIKDIIEKNIKIKIVQNSNYYSIFSLVKGKVEYKKTKSDRTYVSVSPINQYN